MYGIGVWCARNRWPVLAAWLAAVVVSLVGLPQLLSSMGAPSPAIEGSDSARASGLIARELPDLGAEQLVLVVRSEHRSTDDPAFRAAVTSAITALRRDAGVRAVLPMPKPGAQDSRNPFGPLAAVYHDPHNAYALVGVTGDDSSRQLAIPRQRDAVRAAVSAVDPEARTFLLGASSVGHDLRGIELSDLARAELIALPLALLVLLVGLGSLSAAVVPLALGGTSVLVTLGLFSVIAPLAAFDVVLLTIVSMIGLAVGIDYALLVVSRFREELAAGRQPQDAAGTALATGGRTVAYSGLVVVLSTGSMLLIRAQVFAEFAYGTALVIAVSLAAVLTLLPALLVLLPHPQVQTPKRADDGGWARWARHLMRYPWPYALATGALLLAASAPMLDLRLGVDFGRQAIAETPSGRGLDVLERDDFAGAAGVVHVLIPRPRNHHPADTAALVTALRDDPGVAAVVTVDNGSTLGLLAVLPKVAPDAPESVELTRRIRDDLVPRSGLANDSVIIGGLGGLLLDVTEETTDKLWWVVRIVLALSLLLLTVLLRSVLLPIKAVLMNLLATTAAMGLTVLVFQHGLGEPLLGFTSLGSIQVHLPVVVFAVLFGLSMDYEMFLVRRIQEEYLRTGDNTAAVAVGIQRTGKLITVAASIMVVVFASMVGSRALELQQLGFALAVAVVLDATLIRLLLVPSLMQLFGRWNWWLPGTTAPGSTQKDGIALTDQ